MTMTWAEMPYQFYRFSGDDSESFLQGQLTQDITHITAANCHYGAYCNHQGRMQANILLIRDEQGIILRLHEEQAAVVIKRLQMFVLRAAVTVERLPMRGIAGNQAMAEAVCQAQQLSLPQPFEVSRNALVTVYGLPGGYYEVAVADGVTLTLAADTMDIDAVHALRLQQGHFHVLAATYEALLPQQTPLAAWGGISYTKGCYVGQEIIARNKYLGKVNKGLAVAVFSTADTTQTAECYLLNPVQQNGKTVGKVIEFYQGKQDSVCLALLSNSSMGKACEVQGNAAVFHAISQPEE